MINNNGDDDNNDHNDDHNDDEFVSDDTIVNTFT